MKEQVFDVLMTRLRNSFSSDQLIILKNYLYDVFQDYDIVPVKYEVTTYENTDENLIKMFIVSKKIDGLADRSLNYYRLELESKLHLYINKSVVNFTKDDLRVHFAKRMIDNPHLSKTTINNERRVFSSFFKWLHDNDYITKNPMSAIKNVKTDKIIKFPFSEEDVEKMREHLSECENRAKNGSLEHIKAVRDSAVFEFLLSTGCRVSELTGAKLKDLDLHDREIKVFGKGAKERICYLNAKATIKLEKYIALRKDSSPYLFAPVKTTTGQDHLNIGGIGSWLRDMGRELNIDNVHPHRFRRTSATMALNKGMPIEEVQIMLGHSQIDTTMMYAKVKEKKVKQSHEKYM